MTKRESKKKLEIPARSPRPKGNMFNNLRTPEQVESISIEELVAPPPSPVAPSDGQGDRGGQTTPASSPAATAAPGRDFNRRANSIERDALPAGKFPGASKKIYDALYLRTRGAVRPTRIIQATKKQVSEWSGIRNRKTIDGHLRYLELSGLIVRRWDLGSNEGYEFEVLLPEEAPLVDRGTEGVRPLEGSDQKMVRGTDQKMDTGGQSQQVVGSTIYEQAKTFKTKEEINDDEILSEFTAVMLKAVKEVTGREATTADRQRWAELADVLVTELKIAAGRTTVSSAPAFLAEHLRRRLWKKDKRQVEEEGKSEIQQAAPPIDASKCPDCYGTGMFYPEGYDKGVARCHHVKLTGGGQAGE